MGGARLLTAPQPSRPLLPARLASRCRASSREPCEPGRSGGEEALAAGQTAAGVSSPGGSGASDSLRQLRQLQQRMAASQGRLELHVQQEEFGLAAEERDALRLLELEARRLELRAAAAATACVQHRLGTVIQHRRYGYKGVVVGFDPVCLAPEDWCKTMCVDLLPRGRSQPFYHVLVDERYRAGGQTTYVAEENVMPMRTPRPVQHPQLSQFFTGFSLEEGGYVPGPLLRQSYPQEF